MAETLGSLAALVNADLVGDAQISISGVAGVDTAQKGDIVFAENPIAFKKANDGPATAIIVGPGINGSLKPLLRTDNPKYAFSRVVHLFNPQQTPSPGVHRSAVVSESTELGKDVYIGPNVVLEDHVRIGDRCIIEAGVYIGNNVEIGPDSRMGPNVSIYHHCILGSRVAIHSGTVIGGDGFGYVCHDGKQEKLLQLGNVIIEDDIEIGCNCCIDRASFGSTRIGSGTRIDNLVQIGHNVEIGNNCIIVSQVGIAGSSKIGNECVLAGQVGIANHAVIEDRVIIAAQSGIPSGKRVRKGQILFGSPARKLDDFKKQWGAVSRLPKQLANMTDLAQEVAKLRELIEKIQEKS